MSDFLAALGLLLAIEGICFAAFPGAAKRAMAEAAQAKPDTMRIVGVVSACLGVVLIWIVRMWLR
jgi:uncharacterized protein YjeT (DUF2065 family)